ncbi:plasmodesmata-located protein 6-like [Andrographis paniculata]|uniref:plasmodesmata-located protein 6-like n=1 Tax=Andrographis paniculata TaxID=175694 RepID=UPI0021E70694|nr:plasmodesmata-located protein 6-like [Andrographis paniculata]
MNVRTKALCSSQTVLIFVTVTTFSSYLASSSLHTIIYVGCSDVKYNPAAAAAYASNLDFLLSSIAKSAAASAYNAFNISIPGGGAAVYGVFQCRGDLSAADCRRCVSHAVTRLGTACAGSGAGAAAGAAQLEGCFVRYDDVAFVGVEDKSVVSDKCGPSDDKEPLRARDAALAYLTAGNEYFRVSGSGKYQGVAQCVEDLNGMDCQDCLVEAIQRLKTQCAWSTSGDMFLGKCYARFSSRGLIPKPRNTNEMNKTLAIFVGIVMGIAILIIILSILRSIYGTKR